MGYGFPPHGDRKKTRFSFIFTTIVPQYIINLLYVADTLFDLEIAPGYNIALARFAVPYILVSDSNDIVIRKGE